MARDLVVRIVGDSKSLERAFSRSEKSARKFDGAMQKTQRRLRGGGLLAGTVAGVGITAGIQKSVSAASDMQEQISKTNEVFGQSSKVIQDWSETTTNAFGISQRQALATASSFGALFAPLRIVGPEAAKQAQRLTELGADLASFYNTDVQSALDAIRSGVIGEAEPLRRYGVLLSENRVAQQAMADSGKRNAGALTAQEKALARIRLIFQDSGKAQGDFARTSDSLANQTRIAQANIDDFSVILGNTLVPAINTILGPLNEFVLLMRQVPEIGQETFQKGSRLETTLVPNLARQIQEMQRAGKTGAEIIATLRKRLGGSLKADDLIAEAFRFTHDPKYRAEIRKAVEDAKKTVDEELAKVKGPTAARRNAWFDAMIGRREDRVQDIQSLQGQLRALDQIARLIEQRQAKTKDITRRLTLEDELLGVRREQRGIREQIAANRQAHLERMKALAEQARQLASERAEAARIAKQTQLFRVLGFGPGGEDLVPGVGALRRRFARVAQAVAQSNLGKKFQSQIAGIRKVLGDEFTKTDKELRSKIEGMLAAIDDKLKEHGQDRGRHRAFNVNAMLAGLGLSPEEVRALRGRLSRIGPGGTVPGKGVGAFGIVVVNENKTYVDGKVVEQSVTRRQQTRRRRNPAQKRGVHVAPA